MRSIIIKTDERLGKCRTDAERDDLLRVIHDSSLLLYKQVEKVIGDDWMGFEYPMYLNYLDYEHAKTYLENDVTQEKWDSTEKPTDPKTEMVDYMEFAWQKANGERGISASRSISHYKAWLWLDGNEDLANRLEEEYTYYGKPQLVEICHYLNIDPSKYDDGIRTN